MHAWSYRPACCGQQALLIANWFLGQCYRTRHLHRAGWVPDFSLFRVDELFCAWRSTAIVVHCYLSVCIGSMHQPCKQMDRQIDRLWTPEVWADGSSYEGSWFQGLVFQSCIRGRGVCRVGFRDLVQDVGFRLARLECRAKEGRTCFWHLLTSGHRSSQELLLQMTVNSDMSCSTSSSWPLLLLLLLPLPLLLLPPTSTLRLERQQQFTSCSTPAFVPTPTPALLPFCLLLLLRLRLCYYQLQLLMWAGVFLGAVEAINNRRLPGAFHGEGTFDSRWDGGRYMQGTARHKSL